MADKEKVIKGLECCAAMSGDECSKCPYGAECRDTDLPYGMPHLASDALALLKEQNQRIWKLLCEQDKLRDMLQEQEARIKKYEYLFDFLGIGFKEWATKILDGEAEAICEADEHEHKAVITFKLI